MGTREKLRIAAATRSPCKKAMLLAVTVIAALLPAAPAMSAPLAQGLDFEPFPSPPGNVSTNTQDLADSLAAHVTQSPTTMTGVRVEGPDSVSVSVPPNADVAAIMALVTKDAARTVSGATATSVQIKRVSRSRADLTKVRADIERLWRAGSYGSQVTGVGLDASRGVVVVYAIGDSLSSRASIKAAFGDAVVFRQMNVPKAADQDRSLDNAPHYGGAGIRMWNAAHTGRRGHCSTGFPIERGGQRYMLTAAHCLPGGTIHPRVWASAFLTATPIPDTAYYFGSLYTTTMSGTFDVTVDGTQDLYGDWALMSGSSYAPVVYNCANLTGFCTTLNVGAASWTDPTQGTGICTSGWTTAQICRQYVIDTDCTCAVEYSGGIFAVAHIAIFQSDQNNDGVYDCDSVEPGDSGGAVYQGISGRPGYVRAMGIVTGGDGCLSYYTKLNGLQDWDSSVSMPVL